MIQVCVTLMRHITDVVGDAGAQAHAAVVEWCTVQRGRAIVSDRTVEELVALADAFFTESAGSVLPSREVTVAVLLTGLIGDSLTVTRTELSVDHAEFTGVGAVGVRLARGARILNASFITTNLTLLTIGIVLARRLPRNTLAIATEFIGVTVTAASTLVYVGSGVLGDCGSSIGGTVTIGWCTTYDDKRTGRNSDQSRKQTSAHY